jgi:hypothetical protein
MAGIQFYLELVNSEPIVLRRILVQDYYSFYQFHMAIQGAFGWYNCHLFRFSENGFEDKVSYEELTHDNDLGEGYVIKDAKRNKVKPVFNRDGKEFTYIYDFGDHWEHAITRELVINDNIIRPFCLEGSGACPPEDFGGMGGYAEMLQSINMPGHPERESYIEWLGLLPGEIWNPYFCSTREVNKRLCLLEG